MSTQCASSGCSEAATHTVHWPGQSIPMCDEHKAGAENVARAMGIPNLQSTPLLAVRSETVQPETVALVRDLVALINSLDPEAEDALARANAWLEVHGES